MCDKRKTTHVAILLMQTFFSTRVKRVKEEQMYIHRRPYFDNWAYCQECLQSLFCCIFPVSNLHKLVRLAEPVPLYFPVERREHNAMLYCRTLAIEQPIRVSMYDLRAIA
jgi:hypothetical protein